jgi:hypothetical protein
LIKGKLRILDGGVVAFWCPGCNEYHSIPVNKSEQPSWSFNGNYKAPTFSPSIMVKSGHYIDGKVNECWCRWSEKHPGEPSPFKCTLCHSFVTNGKILYLSDCTHKYAGQTLELEYPKNEEV